MKSSIKQIYRKLIPGLFQHSVSSGFLHRDMIPMLSMQTQWLQNSEFICPNESLIREYFPKKVGFVCCCFFLKASKSRKYILKRQNQAKLFGKPCAILQEQRDPGPHHFCGHCSNVSAASLLPVVRKQLLWSPRENCSPFYSHMDAFSWQTCLKLF